jgi:hypothetical protein
MKTLILTGSYDFTSDVIVRHLGSENVFRLNYDLWADYRIEIAPETVVLTAAETETVTDKEISKVLWRKPFKDEFSTKSSIDTYLRAEIKYIFHEIHNLFHREGKTILNLPNSDRYFGKACQLRMARKYFDVAEWFISINAPLKIKAPAVVKSLSSVPVSEGQVLYTREIDPKTLDPAYPWHSQQTIEGEYDVTVVYVYGESFAFRLDRREFEGLDWRQSIGKGKLPWQPCSIPPSTKNGIDQYMREAGLVFGRLDFILNGDLYYFLEVNPNGQWAWLDLENRYGLLRKMISVMHPASPLPNW